MPNDIPFVIYFPFFKGFLNCNNCLSVLVSITPFDMPDFYLPILTSKHSGKSPVPNLVAGHIFPKCLNNVKANVIVGSRRMESWESVGPRFRPKFQPHVWVRPKIYVPTGGKAIGGNSTRCPPAVDSLTHDAYKNI